MTVHGLCFHPWVSVTSNHVLENLFHRHEYNKKNTYKRETMGTSRSIERHVAFV